MCDATCHPRESSDWSVALICALIALNHIKADQNHWDLLLYSKKLSKQTAFVSVCVGCMTACYVTVWHFLQKPREGPPPPPAIKVWVEGPPPTEAWVGLTVKCASSRLPWRRKHTSSTCGGPCSGTIGSGSPSSFRVSCSGSFSWFWIWFTS